MQTCTSTGSRWGIFVIPNAMPLAWHQRLHSVGSWRKRQPPLCTSQALEARRQGAALPLKDFHNDIKRRMITRFAFQAERLLDLACGRGGDIHKWARAQARGAPCMMHPAPVRGCSERCVLVPQALQVSSEGSLCTPTW